MAKRVDCCLKVAIVGMGVAGSYLASRLSNSYKVVCFERLKEDSFDAVCGWATSKHGIASFTKLCGLNFEDYILHEGKTMQVDLSYKSVFFRLKGLCTFDKLRFIRDMAKGQEVKFASYVSGSLNSKYDLVIDATGVIRPLLPRIKRDVLIPCVQYKVKYKEPPFDDFYIKPFLPQLSGYFWFFPLGNGYAHVGSGDLKKRHNEELLKFLKSHPCKVLKKSGRPIRITPPSLCEPFYAGNVVGVGESIGTVYPILGEGIIPSLQCAEILFNNLDDFTNYRNKVLKKFKIYDKIFRFLMNRIEKGFKLSQQIFDVLRIYFYMKANEDRYGLTLGFSDVYDVICKSSNGLC